MAEATRKPGKEDSWDPLLILIKWTDAQTDDEWVSLEDAELPNADCVSVGWLVREDENQITLCHTKGESDDQLCGRIQIPAPWINERHVLPSPLGPSTPQ